MKRKLSRNALVKHILDTMPQDYDVYERLAFIEVEVAKQIAFDEQYLWGDVGTKEKIYKAARKRTQNPSTKTDRKLICITMSELFGYVLSALGYNVEFQKRGMMQEVKTGNEQIFRDTSYKKQEHVCTIVEIPEGKRIEVDIQDDLYRLQTGCKPHSFGQTVHERGLKHLPLLSVDKIFRKIYHLKENEKFMDDYIRELVTELQYADKTPIEIFEILMNDSRIQRQLKGTGCVEANELFKKILGSIYNKKEDRTFMGKDASAIIDECVMTESKGKKKYSFCIYAEDEFQRALFVYSKKSKRMVRLSPEDIKSMKEEPMGVEFRARSSTLKENMMSYINSEAERTQKEQSPTISIEDIFRD